MIIEKLDGFTADGFGNVIGSQNDLSDGDIERVTLENGLITERRFYASVVQPPSQPNNANNPYWPGYVPKGPDQFWGLVQQIFIALQGSNEAGADRFSRLVNSTRASGVIKIIGAVDLINPDDMQGAFLRELDFLTTTRHETDAQFLLSSQEVAAIMQSGNWK